jgi:type IV pilus assembly protein PilA
MWTRFAVARDERDRGFTLIELLVVVIIVGVLAAIAIPVFLNQRKKGVDASLKSDVRTVAGLAETWMVDNPNSAVPGQVYYTGMPAVTGANHVPFQINFTPSPGNFIVLRPSAGTRGGYCVYGANRGATAAVGSTSGGYAAGVYLAYNSLSGGLSGGTTTGDIWGGSVCA